MTSVREEIELENYTQSMKPGTQPRLTFLAKA